MAKPEHRRERELRPASAGFGPLLQRDYWAVIAGCRIAPAEVVEVVARWFERFPPEDLVRFRRFTETGRPLELGDELEVQIRMAGTTAVRVVHRDRNSFTLATVAGHPEAGRITFGAYRNPRGDVVFHIRSRARSRSRASLFGFLTTGDPMQTLTWTDFIDRLAATVGDGVIGAIHAEERRVEEEPADREAPGGPTYVAEGDRP